MVCVREGPWCQRCSADVVTGCTLARNRQAVYSVLRENGRGCAQLCVMGAHSHDWRCSDGVHNVMDDRMITGSLNVDSRRWSCNWCVSRSLPCAPGVTTIHPQVCTVAIVVRTQNKPALRMPRDCSAGPLRTGAERIGCSDRATSRCIVSRCVCSCRDMSEIFCHLRGHIRRA